MHPFTSRGASRLLPVLLCGLSIHFSSGAVPIPKENAARFQGVLARLDASMHRVQRANFDTDSVIEQVGRDPVKLCAWVREQTQFAPYQGALRGPRGVLMDRVGSDLDRALLLAQLVISSGYEVRLAHLTLTEAQATERLNTAPGPRLDAPGGSAPAPEMAALLARAEEQSRRLLALVPAPPQAKWSAEQLRAAQDHWWIQYQESPAKGWSDLDPATAPEPAKPSPPGHLGSGVPTFIVCTLPNLAAKVPADQFHRVEFKVMVERWEEGRLIEETALSWAIQTWNDPSIHLYLFHDFDSAAQVAAGGADAGKLKAAVLSDKKWRPILQLNGQYRGPKSFDESGILSQAAAGGAVAVGNAVRTGFGTLGQAAVGTDGKPKSVLTAEWIDITVTAPGTAPQVIRREVFDSLGPATRASAAQSPLPKPMWTDAQRLNRGLALAGMTDQLVVSCCFPLDYVFYRRSQSFLNDRQQLAQALAEPEAAASQSVLSRHRHSITLDLMNAARRTQHHASPTYIDQPNVCRLITQPCITADGKADSIAICDLAANAVSALGAPAGGFATSMRRGVMDTLCERIAVGEMTRPANEAAVRNTADAFDRGGEWITLRDTGNKAFADLPVNADVRARIAADLGAGNWVVIPKAPIGGRFAWWRISAATGKTVGVMDDGRCGDADYTSTLIPSEQLEITLTTRSRFINTTRPHLDRLARQIIDFRKPGTAEEVIDCWCEAFDILQGL